MPHPTWKHYCSQSGDMVTTGSETCSSCGAFGQYDGWRYGRIEQMSAYQRRTGLKPMGEHRLLVSLILGPMLRPCEQCEMRGLICQDEDEWQRCPQCQGAMLVRKVPDAEFEAARRRILREYPDAEVSIDN
jgi:hypothetical protein